MKNFFKCLAATAAVFMCAVSIPISAATAQGEDDNVQYVYWDQPEVKTYWSGVYNKINYNSYQPCIGSYLGKGGCGETAWQSQYKEHCEGTSILSHYHYLLSGYGTKDYKVE